MIPLKGGIYDVIPSLWVCFSFIDIPLYGYVFQSSAHTSGHR